MKQLGFKIGDKVRTTAADSIFFNKGETGIVHEIDSDGDVWVKFKDSPGYRKPESGCTIWCTTECSVKIEHIKDAEPRKYKVGDLIRTLDTKGGECYYKAGMLGRILSIDSLGFVVSFDNLGNDPELYSKLLSSSCGIAVGKAENVRLVVAVEDLA